MRALMTQLTIATRGSSLARWQAAHIRSLLVEKHQIEVRLLVLKTQGDLIAESPLSSLDGKGFFVKEIEEALLDGRADLAVHSMKDLPMELPVGLTLGAVPTRGAAHDLLLSTRYPDLKSLPAGARVGTGSPRRRSQLLAERPDLEIVPVRGNVDTRLKKLERGDFAALVIAAAGLSRLGLSAPFTHELAPPLFLPAPGQGALGLEFREDRKDIAAMLDFLDDPATHACVEAERGFLAGLGGGCLAPVAAYAIADKKNTAPDDVLCLELHGLAADPEGARCIRHARKGAANEARALGLALAAEVRAAGGEEIMRDQALRAKGEQS
jgi:hydroxymethylbilane synthase